jgi:NAD(P)-dependent dehydrogenase (short-subunit alcohol dehydrogenase family)
MRLQDKKALVTGGGRGIGREIALARAREGADVAVNYVRDTDAAESIVAEIRALGRRATVVQGDTSRAADVARLVTESVDALGHLDVLVNNAAVLSRVPFLELAEEEWDRTLDIGLKGYFLVGQAVARHMVTRGRGSIVNISSINQTRAWPNLCAYSVAKSGVGMLTQCMALELGVHGIRVNAIAAGTVVTERNREFYAQPENRAPREARIPLGRIGHPRELTGMVVYLASDEASYTTGAALFVDGGFSIW